MTVRSAVKPGKNPKYLSSALVKDDVNHCFIPYIVRLYREQGGVWD